MAIVLAPQTGLIEGGTPVRLTAPTVFDMSACIPDFTDEVLDAGFWTDISSGSGDVREIGDVGELQLDTGTTAGSVAGVRTQDTETDVDIAVSLSERLVDAPTLTDLTTFELSLYVSASTIFRVYATRSSGLARIHTTVTVDGNTTFDNVIDTHSGGARLRLLRWGSRVRVFVNSAQRLEAAWEPAAASIELRAANDVSIDGRILTRIRQYARRPVVLFGEHPLEEIILRSETIIEGTTPAQQLPGSVDINATGCEGDTDSEPDGFTYTISPGVTLISQSDATLTTLGDPIVRGLV